MVNAIVSKWGTMPDSNAEEKAGDRQDVTIADRQSASDAAADSVSRVHQLERRLAESAAALRALRLRERRFRALFDRLRDGLFLIDHGLIVYVNQSFADTLGQPGDDLVGRPLAELVAPEDRQAFAEVCRSWDDAPESPLPTVEVRLLHKDEESRISVVMNVDIVELPGGGRAGVGTIHDVTSVRVADAAALAAARPCQEVVENAIDGMYRTWPDGRLTFANAAMARLHGFDAPEDLLAAQGDLAAALYTDPKRRTELLRRLGEQGQVEDFVSEIHRLRSRERIWVSENAWVVRDAEGGVTHIEGTVRDISERRQSEEALRDSEERFRNLVEGSIQGIIVHRDFVPLFANQAMADIFGYADPSEILALDTYLELVDPGDEERVLGFAAPEGAATPKAYEFRGIRRDGSRVWLENRVTSVTWDGRPAMQAAVVDITQRKRAEEQMIHYASHDTLTGLPNRGLGRDRLSLALARARRGRGKAALLFLDLDGFKDVNDSMGHEAGDRLLRELAGRMAATIRETDTVSRHGGDEFVIVLTDLADEHAAVRVAESVIDAVRRPVSLFGRVVAVGASIGIAVYPDHSTSPDGLLRAADAAMYAVKESGKGGWRCARRTCRPKTP